MATPTFDLLGSQTLSADSSSVTFDNIDQSYQNLFVTVDIITTGTVAKIRYNNDAGSNDHFDFSWSGASNGSLFGTNQNNNAARLFSQFNPSGRHFATIDIFDYSDTSFFTTALVHSQEADSGTDLDIVTRGAHMYKETNAITAITLLATSAAFSAGSTFKIYGIA